MPKSQVLDIRIASGWQVTADGVKMKPQKVGTLVQDRLAKDSKLVVSLTMARDCTYKEMVGTLEQIKLAGASRIALNDPE